MRPTCRKCNAKPARKNDTRCWKCASPTRVINRSAKHRNLPHVKERLARLECEFCTYHVIDARLLDVDHIDGNHDNDAPENLQILCKTCHHLKTLVSGEYRRRAR